MCSKNTFLNQYYSAFKVDSLKARIGRGYLACSSSIAVKDDRKSIQGVSGAIS